MSASINFYSIRPFSLIFKWEVNEVFSSELFITRYRKECNTLLFPFIYCTIAFISSIHAEQKRKLKRKFSLMSVYFIVFFLKTRLHSSRMRTARLFTVSPSMHCAGGGLFESKIKCVAASQHVTRQTLYRLSYAGSALLSFSLFFYAFRFRFYFSSVWIGPNSILEHRHQIWLSVIFSCLWQKLHDSTTTILKDVS